MAQVADRMGVGHIVVRSVSDLAGGEADAHFARFVADVAANSARLVLDLVQSLQKDDRDDPLGA